MRFDQALTDHLASFNERDIPRYHQRFDQLPAALSGGMCGPLTSSGRLLLR
jgi:hypothetical protein